MRVVIDTNYLIASIPPKNPEFWLYQAFISFRFDWYISNEIMAEYEEQLTDFYSPRTADLVLKILSVAPNVTFAEPYTAWQLIEDDPDDNKFANLAFSANVDYLVTNDRHFNVLKNWPFPTVQVVSLEEFRVILGYSNGQRPDPCESGRCPLLYVSNLITAPLLFLPKNPAFWSWQQPQIVLSTR